jgi:hypothetical protein
MLRHEFLLNDVDSILASGEVPGIFSTDEKHELNEVREFHFLHFYSISKSVTFILYVMYNNANIF